MKRVFKMIVGGLVLAFVLFLGLSLAERRDGMGVAETSPTSLAEKASLTPVTFGSVTESLTPEGPALRLDGQAEPGSIIVLLDRGETVSQVRTDETGRWGASLPIPARPMAIEAVMFDSDPVDQTERAISIRGVETIFYIQRSVGDDDPAPALLLITSPGAASRLVQSPFGGLPGSGDDGRGPLFLGPIDYDDAGGVIFSGLSSEQGRVRLYVSGSAIGDTRVGPDGHWAYIASSVLPLGEHSVRAELIMPDQQQRAEVEVPFERLAPLPGGDNGGDDGALSVIFEPFHWQIRRALVGGGSQSTVIFSPIP